MRAAAVAATAAVVAATPFLVGDYLLTILILGFVYTVLVTGLNLFMGYTGQVSFGHNGFAAIGGYGSALLALRWEVPPILCVLAAAGAAVAVAFAVGVPTLRLRGHTLAMATLALGLITYEVAVQWTAVTQGYLGLSAIPPLGLGPWELASDAAHFWAYATVAAAGLWAAARIRGSRLGRALAAISGSEDAAAALGIDVARYKVTAFAISAAYASVGGSLLAHYVGFISPEVFGLHMVVLLFTMLFVGGVATPLGPLLGALLIGALPELLREVKDYRELVYGALLVLVLVFAPRGLYSLAPRRLRLP